MKYLKKTGRRAFLLGAGGAALALPLLQYTQGRAIAEGGSIAKRFIVCFSHGGTILARARRIAGTQNRGQLYSHLTTAHHGYDDWGAADPGEELVLGPIMQPLGAAGLTEYLLLPRAVDNMAGQTAPYGGGHKSANVSALTCQRWNQETRVRPSDGYEYEVFIPHGPSIEQVIAQRLQAETPTPFGSVNLKVDGHQYGSPFFSAASTGVSSESSPANAFSTLFAGLASDEPDPALLRQQRMRGSVLDGVLQSLQDMRSRLGREDRLTLEAHEEHVRSLERRIQDLENIRCTAPEAISSDPDSKPALAELHADLIVHALRCGLTNVATLQISDFVTDWLPTPYSRASYSLGHTLHHAGRDVGAEGANPTRREDWRAEMLTNRQWRMEVFGRILTGLRDTPEGDGNMLDNSIALYTSEFSYGAIHNPTDQPILLAGCAGGQWRTGRHLNYNLADTPDEYETETSTHNVYTSILHAFGYEDDHFGSDDAAMRGPLDFT